MLSNILASIEGVAAYPMVSLLIFLPFFIVITVRVWRMKKNDAEEMSRIPLEDEPGTPSISSNANTSQG